MRLCFQNILVLQILVGPMCTYLYYCCYLVAEITLHNTQAWILWAWTVLGDAPRACTALLHCTSWFLLGALFLHWTKI